MKIFFNCRIWAIALLCIVAVAMPMAALASGGGGHGAEGGGGGSHWAATDTYKVMNFAVLAIALFFLLKKPLTQALNGRIEGIREQLEELEAKKNIEHEFMQAKEQLKREIVDEAMAKAEALITGAISAEDQNKLVDEYLQKVVA